MYSVLVLYSNSSVSGVMMPYYPISIHHHRLLTTVAIVAFTLGNV